MAIGCVVCMESKAAAAFPGSPLTDRCNHAPRTCLECVSGSIRTHIESGLSTDVPCPECTGIMSSADIQRYADSKTRQRYDELRLYRVVEEDEDFIWCSAGCGSGQIHEDGLAQPIVKCASCGCKTCFLCKVPWHVGLTCDEWSSLVAASAADDTSAQTLLQRAEELRASKDTIDQTTKPCPRCSWNIEKNGGWCVV
ncbi:hypothetical protein C8A01DRAFT_51204 [Parachaetomium inaequale]|uniref:RBR-type E3 ubiquitin transferase n=1 Tax=Parachaetomium inaequale TaxID=2588326 RepID=A0AAN6P545_9PEZI|nr:hypothetical protein C8A01DRAFT_51204 [Parachaetomium inaequale]